MVSPYAGIEELNFTLTSICQICQPFIVYKIWSSLKNTWCIEVWGLPYKEENFCRFCGFMVLSLSSMREKW